VRLGQWIGLLALLYLFTFLNPANCFVLQQLVNNLKPSRANFSDIVLSEVLPLPSQLLCYWLIIVLCGDCATHCRAIATMFNILPQVSVRLRAWFDWLQSVIPGPMLEQFRSLENLPQQLQTWALLLSNFCLTQSLAIVLACCCSWF